MMKPKHRRLWRLGATSCVLPADIMANVRVLAPLVDDVQLLFFESENKRRLPQPLNVQALRDIADGHNLTYTVHLPTDISLGAAARVERQAGISEILRLMDRLAPLDPQSFDLHLVQEQDLLEAQWLDNLAGSLQELSAALGAEKRLVAVENIAYPYDLVAAMVMEYGFSVCLDLGHLIRYGHDLEAGLSLLPWVRHLHYHGVQEGRDHQSLSDTEQVRMLTRRLATAEFAGVVTLEMYSLENLKVSLAFFDRVSSIFF